MRKRSLVVAIILALYISGCTQNKQIAPQPSSTLTPDSSASVPSDISSVSEPQSQSSADSRITKDEISTFEENKSDVTSSAPSSQADNQNKGAIVIDISNVDGKSITESSSFKAENGDVLTLEITSTISGGSADLFLFSPDNKEQRISIGNTKETQTIALSDGEWAYNCTGFFDSGSIKIVGTVA